MSRYTEQQNAKKTSFQAQMIMAAVMATAVGISFIIFAVTIYCGIRFCVRRFRKRKKSTSGSSSQVPTSQMVTSLPQTSSMAPSTQIILIDPAMRTPQMPASETQGDNTGETTTHKGRKPKPPIANGKVSTESMPDAALDKTQSLKASNKSRKKMKEIKESERHYKVVKAPDNLDKLGPLCGDPPTTRAQVQSGAIDNSSLIDQFNF